LIEKLGESSGNMIGFKLTGTITKDDYDVMVPEVEKLIKEHGNIRLLIDMDEFKWESIKAWGADMKFGKHLHKRIDKMAIVGDKKWEGWITHLAGPFFANDSKFFHPAEAASAWAWLRE
jgi:hypothetical protein